MNITNAINELNAFGFVDRLGLFGSSSLVYGRYNISDGCRRCFNNIIDDKNDKLLFYFDGRWHFVLNHYKLYHRNFQENCWDLVDPQLDIASILLLYRSLT